MKAGIFFSLLSFYVLTDASAAKLSLEDYQNQVTEKGASLRASQLKSEGGFSRKSESLLLYSPALIADAHFSWDEKQKSNPSTQGTSTDIRSYSFGIAQNSPVGLKGSFRYQIDHFTFEGVNKAMVPLDDYYEAAPILEGTFSLWRNLFGAETRATFTSLEASALQSAYGERYETKNKRAAAEMAYWRLSLARENLQILTDSLGRAKVLRDWSQKRSQSNLADKSDLLQTQAAYQIREMDLKRAIEDERQARMDFNLERGLSSDEVSEELETPNFENFKVPEKTEVRDDLKAMEQVKNLQSSQAELAKQRNLPQVELYGSYAFNKRDSKLSEVTGDFVSNEHPTRAIGLRISTPIFAWSQKKVIDGYNAEKRAAELSYERMAMNEANEWENLNQRFVVDLERWKMAVQLEAAQKEKVLHERNRHQQGRTTTYQVILFEQDYASARISRIQLESELAAVVTQLKKWSQN